MMRIFFLSAVLLCSVSPLYAQSPNMTLSSSAFVDQGDIPLKYTCQGENINPPLKIEHVPAYTKNLVLIVRDPDAPQTEFIHWVVYNIDPALRTIDERSVPGDQLINDFHQFEYRGPCPPLTEEHRYIFDLYALDKKFEINYNGTLTGLEDMMQGHILDKTRLVGVFRKRPLKN